MLQSRHAYNQGRRCESARNRICGTNAPATLPQLECQLISNRQVLAERSIGGEGGERERGEPCRCDAVVEISLEEQSAAYRATTVFFQLLVIRVYLLHPLICLNVVSRLPPPNDESIVPTRVCIQQRSKVFRIDRIHEIQLSKRC